MASQISHVVYGKKIFDRVTKIKKDLEWRKFLLGTTFPDIRQLAGLDRKLLHWGIKDFESIATHPSFDAGIYAHSWVDLQRSAFLRRSGVFDYIPSDPITNSALKLVEDQIVYEKITNWQEIISMYDVILPEEVKLVPIDIVERWHKGLKDYFKRRPDSRIIAEMIDHYTVYSSIKKRVLKEIKIIRQIREVIEILGRVYDIF
jgi:hypothetical protein